MRLRRCGVELHYIGDCFGSFIGYRENVLETGSKFVLQNSTSPMVQFCIKQTQVSRATSIMWPMLLGTQGVLIGNLTSTF